MVAVETLALASVCMSALVLLDGNDAIEVSKNFNGVVE